jgi:zinc transporter, ZIP family
VIVVVVAIVALVGGLATALDRSWSKGSRHETAEATARVVDSRLLPGQILLTLRNDSAETVRIAQVMVNDAFVDFHARRLVVASGGSTRLLIGYPWVEGEGYEVGVVTSNGQIIADEIEHAGDA